MSAAPALVGRRGVRGLGVGIAPRKTPGFPGWGERTARMRAIGGVCLMSILTANDYYLSRRLRDIQASYNPTAGPKTLAPS
ncbi:MAG TPA: hypothetical protein VJ827_12830 [Rubrobacter sp.]|nr:hypothetical protein [Rubrobacter sp.]